MIIVKKDRSRSKRRHQLHRIKEKVKHYYGGVHKDSPKYIGMAARTRQPCSCWWCGNPRKHFNERTKQEMLRTLKHESGDY